MDRFIERTNSARPAMQIPLKSNMDRFIGLKCNNEHHKNLTLKSNMDRFIDFFYRDFS